MEQKEDVFQRAYRYLVEKKLERLGVNAVGLRIVRTDENREEEDDQEIASQEVCG